MPVQLFCERSKSLAGKMKLKTRETAADMAKRAPEVGHLIVRIVENDSRGIEFLHKASTTFKAQPFSLCPRRYPCKSKVGDKVIVVVESADVAMATRKEHFNNSLPVAPERNILKELPCLVTGNGMTCPSHVARTICRNIKPNSRVNRVPKPKIGDVHA